MTGMTRMMLAALVGAALALGSSARAEEKKAGGDAAGLSDSAQAVSDLTLAHQLAAYGRRTKSAEALVTAARILGTVPTDAGTDAVEGGEKAEFDAKKEALALLDEAKGIRSDDKALAEMIAGARDAINTKERGSTGGAFATTVSIGKGGTATLKREFKAKETGMVTIIVIPNASAPLKKLPANKVLLRVTGPTGATVGQDWVLGYDMGATVKFMPPAKGVYTVHVVNGGMLPERVIIRTN